MLYAKLAAVAALSATVFANSDIEARANNNAGGSGGLTLDTANVQIGSEKDGSNAIGSASTQALSTTSNNNFINFCSGKTLTNGIQHIEGSCNGIVMGDIPAKTNMVSTTILFPTTGGADIDSDTTFNVSVLVRGINLGSFSNADTTYYAAPQQLSGGNIVGHTHITIQDMGNTLNPQSTLDPTLFSFFKGVDDAGDGKGHLEVPVTGGLPAGIYRVCTLASSTNHQAVIMPVAQRGSENDCTKFTVGGSGTTINIAANDGSKGIAAAALVSEAARGFTDAAFAASVISSESAAAAAAAATPAATTTPAAAAAAAAGNGKGGKGGNKNTAPAAVGTTATANTAATAAAAAAGRATTKATATAAAKAGTGKTGGAGRRPGGAGRGRGRGRKQRFAKREFVV